MESLKQIKIRKDKSDRATTDKVLDNKTMMILKKLEEKGVLKGIRGCISSGKEANIYIGTSVGDFTCKFMKNKTEFRGENIELIENDEQNEIKNNDLSSDENKNNEYFKNEINNDECFENDKCLSLKTLFVNEKPTTNQQNSKFNRESPVIIKIYRTSRLEFRNRQKYIENETRFKTYCNKNPRKLIKLWAEKETRNLKRLQNAGIPSPIPLYLKRNILIMSIIGSDEPAPRLKDLDGVKWDHIYLQTIDIIKKMYLAAKIVHGDLSEYNLLFQDKIFVIDVGQSVDVYHENADSFLINDLKNITSFFRKKGVGVQSINDVFEEVTCRKIPICLGGIEIESNCFIPKKIDDIVEMCDINSFLKDEKEIKFNIRQKRFEKDLNKEIERIDLKKRRKELKEKLKEKRMMRDKKTKKKKNPKRKKNKKS
ncbi:putative serine/threonine-protein kinase RIO1 like protein [Dictyocoela muelleri]|nr:putative serine/threonine-protein kinase RIO1 like protein [Dictyocoela muelleri]